MVKRTMIAVSVRASFALMFIGYLTPSSANAQSVQNLGLVGIKSSHNRYLQAHTDGELHVSNSTRNEEETWFLIAVDANKHIYAMYNWRTGNFLSKRPDTPNCARADRNVLSDTEKWVLVSGKPSGVLNAVMIKSLNGGILLGGNAPGDDTKCHGEVNAVVTGPVNPKADWGGWWVFETANRPSPGRDFWNTVGGAVAGITNKVSPADVVAVLVAVAG